MREYLFRGKRLDNGEWVEGSLLTCTRINKGKVYICPETNVCEVNMEDEGKIIDVGLNFGCWYEVDPETVGQFTGGVEFSLEGAEERKIFDGDIVQVLSGYGGKGVFLVVWNYESAGWYWKHLRGTRMFYGNEAFGMKILGNRWDNPELLEGTS